MKGDLLEQPVYLFGGSVRGHSPLNITDNAGAAFPPIGHHRPCGGDAAVGQPLCDLERKPKHDLGVLNTVSNSFQIPYLLK